MSANKSGGGIGSVNSVTPRAETGFADVFSSFDASIDASINATYDSRLDAFEGTSQPPHSGSPGGYGGSPPTKPGATTVVPNSLDHSAIETPAVHSLDTFDITGDFPLLSQLSAPSSSAPNSPTKRQSKRSNPGTRQMELQLQALSSQSGPVKSFLPSPITLNIRPQMQVSLQKKYHSPFCLAELRSPHRPPHRPPHRSPHRSSHPSHDLFATEEGQKKASEGMRNLFELFDAGLWQM